MSGPYSEAFMGSRLLRQFERTGRPGKFTDAFDRLPLEAQRRLCAGAGLQEGEVPVLACVLGDELWTLLTTRRVVWCDAGTMHRLSGEEVQDATVDGDAVMTQGPQAKREFRELKIVTTSGDIHVIQLEPGPSFFGFWNAMKLVARMGERRKAQASDT